QARVLLPGRGDLVEEPRPDDAAGPPQRRARAEVDAPAVLLAGRGDLVEALRVGDDLRGVQRLAHVLDEALGQVDPAVGAGQDAHGALALLDAAGQGPRERGLGDAGDRHAQVEGVLDGPAPGALLPGLVED